MELTNILGDVDITKIWSKLSLSLTRTQNEIQTKIKESDSMFGFEREVLVDFLDWDKKKEYYKDEFVAKVEAGEQKPVPATTDINEALEECIEYLDFALGKAYDQRGLSASRSIVKLGAWLWLFGNEELIEDFEDADYAPYGAPKLLLLLDRFGLESEFSRDDFSL